MRIEIEVVDGPLGGATLDHFELEEVGGALLSYRIGGAAHVYRRGIDGRYRIARDWAETQERGSAISEWKGLAKAARMRA